MDLIALVVVVALVGLVVWIITTKVPMPPGWATTVQVLALILLVLWIISQLVPLPNVLPHR